jgi:hypothetical protein
MLGYTPSEIHALFNDQYTLMVYVKDRQRYLHFIEELAAKEQTLTIQYRIVRKDGHTISLNDTMTSRRLEDGHMYGFSIVADMTAVQNCPSDQALAISSQIVNSYGYMHCTYGKYPKVTHINAQMMSYLGLTAQDADGPDLLKENLFFMIPVEEHELFQNYMEKALLSTKPVYIKHHFFCKDGKRLALNGWMSSIQNKFGETEYAMIYMNDGHNTEPAPNIVESSYFQALKSAYNIIFELNLSSQTMKCIHGRNTSAIGSIYDVQMTLASAKSFYLNNYVIEEDQDATSRFWDRITSPPVKGKHGSHVVEAEFRINWTDHIVHRLSSIAFQLNEDIVLLCCRDIYNSGGTDLSVKNTAVATVAVNESAFDRLQSWLDCIATYEKSALGVVVLEKSDTSASIVYMSKRVRNYLGFDVDTYNSYISGECTAQQLLDAVSLNPCDLEKLLQSDRFSLTAKGSFTNSDSGQNYYVVKDITLTVCLHDCNGRSFYELLVYNENASQLSPTSSKNRIFARTFGHFDLFVDHVPVVFSNKKEKEFMALLIDRNGGTLDTNEAISYLWEDEEVNERISRRYRKLCTTLKNTLIKHGIEHIVINNHGIRSIDTSALTCDYYELLNGNPKYKDAFHNVYMADYSWGESTLANLWDYS